MMKLYASLSFPGSILYRPYNQPSDSLRANALVFLFLSEFKEIAGEGEGGGVKPGNGFKVNRTKTDLCQARLALSWRSILGKS